MEEYNYDELMERVLAGERLGEDEWKFLIYEGEEIDRVKEENRRWSRWVDRR